MSAIPATRTTTSIPAAPSIRLDPGPRSSPKKRSRARSRTNAASIVLGRMMAFCLIGASTYLASSMAGQVMVEKTRREGISAQRRAAEANRSEISLRARINELTGFSNMEMWATSHGFVPSDQPAKPPLANGAPTLVAKNN